MAATTRDFPLKVDKRVPFDDTLPIIGVDLSSATFVMQVRALPGDTGTPMLDLATIAAPAQGLSASYDTAFLYGGTTVPATILRIIINETSLEALALGTPHEQPLTLHYDMHVTPSPGKKSVLLAGRFIINPGVTL